MSLLMFFDILGLRPAIVSVGMRRERIEVPRKSIYAHTYPPISDIF